MTKETVSVAQPLGISVHTTSSRDGQAGIKALKLI
jgi:hypothetical protein